MMKDFVQIAWENLANAIVMQALEDYLTAKAILRQRPDLKRPKEEIREFRALIRSDYFHAISALDEETIWEIIRIEEKNWYPGKSFFTDMSA